MSGRLIIVPCSLREANAFVIEHHRHMGQARGCIFTLAVSDEGNVIRGVALIGRPVARGFDDGWTVEINRLCTDGASMAASMLYARSRRVAAQLGYRRIVTYTLPEESGASLRAAGYTLTKLTNGGSWSCASRPRIDTHPLQKKLQWMSWMDGGYLPIASNAGSMKHPPQNTPRVQTELRL